MLRTIYALQTSRIDRFFRARASPHLKQVARVMDLVFEHCLGECGEEVLVRHERDVREVCERMGKEVLRFELGEGWGPLCEFLEREEPDVEWPRVNDAESFRRAFRLDAWSRGVVGAGVVAGLAVVGRVGLYLYGRFM